MVIIPSHFVYDLVNLFVPFFPLLVLVTAAHINLYFRVNDVNLIVSLSGTILMNKYLV